MRILGIETSCDETSAAIVENGTKILNNVVASSQELHIKTGGIIPEIAAREQVKCLLPVINEAMKQCNNDPIDTLAVTIGPGLIGSLLVGVETAKTLAYIWNKPIVPVNHLVAHLYANWLSPKPYTPALPAGRLNPKPSFPAVALIASGGHTDLVLIKGHAAPAYATRKRCGRGKLQWLGGTRDDASGEAFDKIARILGLGYPGGPGIAAEAAKFFRKAGSRSAGKVKSEKLKVSLPRPMMDSEDFDFSFSGLKTAVLREVNRLKTMKQFNNLTICHLAYETQEAIIDVLVDKTLRAAKKYQVKSILLGGGVAANSRLREKFNSVIEQSNNEAIKLFVPPKSLCTDNAAVIATAAFFDFKPQPWGKITANPGLYF